MRVGRVVLGGVSLAILVAVMTGVSGHASAADDPSAPVIACPVAGGSTFDDSFGWARSGGRRHQGIDMVAERGTPVVAAVDGDVQFKHSRLGGKSAWLYADDGGKFFYAHLNGWEGESRDVARGEVIGYVGSTGNAGGPHLHFETHYTGRPENPYPAVSTACAAPSPSQSVTSPPLGPLRLR